SSNTNGAVELLIDVGPGVANVEIHCINNTLGANGVVFSAAFADDICEQEIDIYTEDENPCGGIELVLEAKEFPNTTYEWIGPSGFSYTGRIAKRYPITVAHTGEYSVIATRNQDGITCTYFDTIYIDVKHRPNPTTLHYSNSPQCQGDTVKLFATTGLTSGGHYVWYGPRIGDPIIDTFFIPHFSPSDTGSYFVYGVLQEGCNTDTTEVKVKIHPVATALWESTLIMDCETDTLELVNLSVGAGSGVWDFDDGTPLVDLDTNNPHSTHVYQNQGVFNVKLKVWNEAGACPDSLVKEINAMHPLNAAFTVDRDTLCQGELVRFINQSDTAYPGTTLHYVWNFGDGSDSVAKYTAEYAYPYSGAWEASLMLQDFLGCRDTATKTIYVDSTGGIYFAHVSDT